MNIFHRKSPEEKAAEEAANAVRFAAEKAAQELKAEREKRIREANASIRRYRTKVAPKWEYFTVEFHRPNWQSGELMVTYEGQQRKFGDLWKIMDELGENGWEMVGVFANTDWNKFVPGTFAVSYTGFAQIYFKRPLTELPDELKQLLNNAENYGKPRSSSHH